MVHDIRGPEDLAPREPPQKNQITQKTAHTPKIQRPGPPTTPKTSPGTHGEHPGAGRPRELLPETNSVWFTTSRSARGKLFGEIRKKEDPRPKAGGLLLTAQFCG